MASDLGLSYTTFRRRLGEAIGRIVDTLQAEPL